MECENGQGDSCAGWAHGGVGGKGCREDIGQGGGGGGGRWGGGGGGDGRGGRGCINACLKEGEIV